jgi:excisionase family DNA binding protein
MAARGHAATRNDADADALLDTEKAAELLGLSVRTLTRRAKDGRIPARRIGGGYVFRTSTIRQYLGAQQ